MNILITTLIGLLCLVTIVMLYIYLHRKTINLHLKYDQLEELVLKSDNITELEMLKKDLEKLARENFSREFFYRAQDMRHLIEQEIKLLVK